MTTDLVAPAAAAPYSFTPIPTVIREISRGGVIVLVDDEHRENEGDLVVASECATPEVVNFMITHGRGLVCVSITEERSRELDLPLMVSHNSEAQATAFTVSVDASERHGVTTGISAYERARTIEVVLRGTRADLRTPGHMFPLVAREGGTLQRPGHTEASVDLARLSGLMPSGVIAEIIGDDGHMLRREGLMQFAHKHGLIITSIELLASHLQAEGLGA